MEQGRKRRRPENGWEEKGGYMNAKVQKLQEQFNKGEHLQLSGDLIVLPEWITQSIAAGRRLDVQPFLLYDQPVTQKTISFPRVATPKSTRQATGQAWTATGRESGVVDGHRATDAAQDTLGYDVLLATSAASEGPDTPLCAAGSPMDDWQADSGDDDGEHFEAAHEAGLPGMSADRAPGAAEVSVAAAAATAASQPSRPDLSAGMGHAELSKTSTHPALKAGESGFVAEFYGHSRLHHLATWGAELRQFTSMLSDKPASRGLEWRRRHPAAVAARPGTRRQRTVMHVDMDCFFVAISLRSFPQHVGKPVAVTHGSVPKSAASAHDNRPMDDDVAGVAGVATVGESSISDMATGNGSRPQPVASLNAGAGGAGKTTAAASDAAPHSSADIASCSYEARAQGVKNGMWLKSAVQLCPELVTVPYDFAAYRVASQSLYEVMTSYSRTIEAVSCDEVFIDVSKLVNTDEEARLLAEDIRKSILEATGVTASAGIASNVLLARMATRLGKPNGQYLVTDPEVLEFIGKQDVGKLPGVGTCLDLRKLALSALQEQFGPKTGHILWNHARGKDDRDLRVSRERKSISAEINYGMRFKQRSDVEKFVVELSTELEQRMVSCQMKGHHLCLKMKVKKPTAPTDSKKYLGHGMCDNVTRSISLPSPVSDSTTIRRFVWMLIDQLKVEYPDIRGMGIQMQRLVSTDKVGKPTTAPIRAFFTAATRSGEGGAPAAATVSSVKTPRGLHQAPPVCQTSPLGVSSSAVASPSAPALDPPAPNAMATPVAERSVVAASGNAAALVSGDEHRQADPSTQRTRHTPRRPPLPFLPTQSAYELAFPAAMHAVPAAGATPGRNASSARSDRVPPVADAKSATSAAAPAPQHAQASSISASAAGGGPPDFALPAQEDLDASVLAALPDDIRRDIELAYQQQRGNLEGGVSRAAPGRETEKLSHSDLFPSTSQRLEEERRRSKPRKVWVKKLFVRREEKGRFNNLIHELEEEQQDAFKKILRMDAETFQLDRSVLADLPPALRAEIMYDHRNFPQQNGQQQQQQQQQPPKPKLQKKQQAAEQKPQVVAHGQQSRSKYHIASSAERQMHLFADPVAVEAPAPSKTYALVAELKGHSELPQVKKVLQDWVLSTDDPEAVDGLIVAKYLAQLMQKYNLQQSWLLLQAFHRLVEKRSSWHFIFNAVLSYCQAEVKVQWDSDLPLKPFSIGNS